MILEQLESELCIVVQYVLIVSLKLVCYYNLMYLHLCVSDIKVHSSWASCSLNSCAMCGR